MYFSTYRSRSRRFTASNVFETMAYAAVLACTVQRSVHLLSNTTASTAPYGLHYTPLELLADAPCIKYCIKQRPLYLLLTSFLLFSPYLVYHLHHLATYMTSATPLGPHCPSGPHMQKSFQLWTANVFFPFPSVSQSSASLKHDGRHCTPRHSRPVWLHV